MDIAETWQQAAARELFEETNIVVDPAEIEVSDKEAKFEFFC